MTNVIIRSDEGLTLETSAFQFLYGGQFTLSTVLINQILMSSLLWRNIKILGSLSRHNKDGRNNVTSLHSQLARAILVFAHNFRSCFHPFHDTEWPVLQLCGQNDQFWIFSQISKALGLPTQTYFWCHFCPSKNSLTIFLGERNIENVIQRRETNTICICSQQSTQTIIILL